MSTPKPPLKDPVFAAVLAWLVPGLGHLYQGRIGKGLVFAVCLLSTFFYGMYLGNWGVVYLRWDQKEQRWAYLCQVGIGLPALPAFVQWWRHGWPDDPIDAFQAPPSDRELDERHRLGRFFEIGTVYTMIAGLLNILAIYDACAGPAYFREEEQEKDGKPRSKESHSASSGARQLAPAEPGA